VRWIVQWIHDKFVYTAILSVIQISFFEIMISGMLQLHNMTYLNYFSSISTVVGYVASLSVLVWIQYNLNVNVSNLQASQYYLEVSNLQASQITVSASKLFAFKITMTEDESSQLEKRYTAYEVIQKCWFCIVIVTFTNHALVQLILMAFANILLIIQLSKWRQFQDKRFKILNLALTLIIFLSVCFFAIDDDYDIMTETQKIEVGWGVDALIVMYALCIFVKFFIVSYHQWREAILYVLKMYRLCLSKFRRD